MDLVNAEPQEAQKIVARMWDSGLTDAEILLITLWQHTHALRRSQRLYYKSKDKSQLTRAIELSDQTDEFTSAIEPVISSLLAKVE